MPTFLHIGCGPKRKAQTTRGFNTPAWTELRFDIDASVKPDLIGTMTDMLAVASESVDAPMAQGNLYMAHRCGFTLRVLKGTLQSAGFQRVGSRRRTHPFYDLYAVATKNKASEAEVLGLAQAHFPA